jgi:hypothetical protein
MSFPPGTEMFQFPGFASLAGYFLAEVGFPIRIPMDQSSFAAPHGFSQRTTSFIASQRQGIHRMPLSHLITLIIDAHAAFHHAGANTEKDLSLEFRPGPVRLAPSHPFARSIGRLSTTTDAGHRADPPSREPARSKRTFSSR